MKEEIIAYLKTLRNERNIEGMGRFGINNAHALGIGMVALREIAKPIGKNHELARELWRDEIHEARILAAIIADPKKITKSDAEELVSLFDSWDFCDQFCMKVFPRSPFGWEKAFEWTEREHEFEKRSGFACFAGLAVHDKKAVDDLFYPCFDSILEGSTDERNFVKKAVNWALRQIGKRNDNLLEAARETCYRLISEKGSASRSARWIAHDALREFEKRSLRNL